jgi:hypothetical protein
MASVLYKLGDFTFPRGTTVQGIQRGRTIGSQKLARATGNRQTAGSRNGISIALRVPIVKGPFDTSDHRTRVDALRAALAVGPARFWLYSDRYYRCCEAQAEPEDFGDTGFNRVDEMHVTIIGPDPLMFSSTDSTDTWTSPTSGGTRTVTAGGNAPAAPSLSLTVGGSGAETIDWEIENSTTGEVFTLAGDVTAGDVIVVNTLAKTVKIGTTDRKDLFDGLFLSLAAGANSLTNTQTASSIASLVTAWTDRYE